MNSLFLLVTAAVVFVFGYRFYSRLLAVEVFRLNDNYSIPAEDRPAEAVRPNLKRHMLAGHHVASLAAGAAVLGGTVALLWGWIPAFLWVVVGTVIAAGTYGLGGLWMSQRFPGLNPAEIAARLFGEHAHTAFALLGLVTLLVLGAASAVFAAHVFAAFPRAALPFGMLLALAYLLGLYLRGREDFEIVPAALVALALALLAIGLSGEFPLAFTGALTLAVGDVGLTLDARSAWIVVLFVYGYHATRQPMWKLIRPRGFLTTLLLACLLLVFCLAVVIDHPTLNAPDFHSAPELPDTLPWLFLALTSGAMAGVHLLFANAVTARQMKRESDARYLGYGGAVAVGLVALSAVIIGGIGFAGVQELSRAFGAADGPRDLPKAFDLYIHGFAELAGALGLGREFARTLAAVVVLGLLTATLEAGLRAQKHLLAGLAERYPSFLPSREKTQIVTVVLVTALLAVADGLDASRTVGWFVYALADLLLGVIGFALLLTTLRRQGQPLIWVSLPLVFLALLAHWALFTQLAHWWTAGLWSPFGLGVALLACELALAWLAFKTWTASDTSAPT